MKKAVKILLAGIFFTWMADYTADAAEQTVKSGKDNLYDV